MVEIYGLFDPDSGELRYVGKAKFSKKRLRKHLDDAKREDRPVCLWIRGLIECAKQPVVRVLETVLEDDWKAAERRLIAEHRQTSNLLNLAPGGDMPSATREQCVKAACAANAVIAKQSPQWRAFCTAKRDLSRFATSQKKRGDMLEYYVTRFHMRARAIEKPHLYGEWLDIHG